MTSSPSSSVTTVAIAFFICSSLLKSGKFGECCGQLVAHVDSELDLDQVELSSGLRVQQVAYGHFLLGGRPRHVWPPIPHHLTSALVAGRKSEAGVLEQFRPSVVGHRSCVHFNSSNEESGN